MHIYSLTEESVTLYVSGSLSTFLPLSMDYFQIFTVNVAGNLQEHTAP